jgi:hypothetical protein
MLCAPTTGASDAPVTQSSNSPVITAANEIRAERVHTWFGGEDLGTGLAMPGGAWDFADGTTQGWTSEDMYESMDLAWYFRHVTVDSCVAHGDPTCTVITPGGSLGSLWCGIHEDDARTRCFPGGQGYGNHWWQAVSKGFAYSGTGDITVEFDYFVDCETDFDFVYVYVLDDMGYPIGPFNTSQHPNADGYGYSRAVAHGTAIGSPSSPAHDIVVIPETEISGLPWVDVLFVFVSDLGASDEWDGSGTTLDTSYGAFGIDNVSVTGNAINDFADFEPGGDEFDGWYPWPVPWFGPWMHVADLVGLDPSTSRDSPGRIAGYASSMSGPICRWRTGWLIASGLSTTLGPARKRRWSAGRSFPSVRLTLSSRRSGPRAARASSI